MFAASSTHKRRRGAQRADAASRTLLASSQPGSWRRIASRATLEAEGEGSAAATAKADAALDSVVGDLVAPHKLHILLPANVNFVAPHSKSWHSAYAELALSSLLGSELLPLARAGLTALAGRPDESDAWVCQGGKLSLTLTRDSYFSLGLSGRRAHFSRNSSGWAGDRKSGAVERYYVDLDLCESSFIAGRKGFERAKTAFETWDARRDKEGDGKWDAVICWDGESVPCETLPVPHAPLSLDATTELLEDVWLPNLRSLLSGASGWNEEWESVSEWAALASLKAEGIRTYARPQETSFYVPPEPKTPGSLKQITYTGLLPTKLIIAVLGAVREQVDQGKVDWAHVTCSGWRDTCVAWRNPRSAAPPARSTKGKEKANALPVEAIAPADEPTYDVAMDISDYEGSSDEESDASSVSSDASSDSFHAEKRVRAASGQGKSARRARSKKVKRRGHVRKGEAEHGIEGGGAHGWSAVLLPRPKEGGTRWCMVEDVGVDLRN